MTIKNSFRLVRNVVKINIFGMTLLAMSMIAVGQINPAPVSAAVCGAEPTSTTGKVSQTITVPATDDYTIWSRLKAPTTSPVEYKVYVDGECFTIGQTALSANTLTWIDHENGTTSDKATVNLPAGTHTLILTAGTEDLELDRVMLLSDNCTPTGTGDNCVNDTVDPAASISAPTAGATVSATTNITANASDNDAIDRVEFYRAGSTLLGSDNAAPYAFSWDTTTVSDGSHSLTVRAYDLSGNMLTSSAVSVTVNNTPPVNAVISSFTATPSTITNGQSSTLAWSVSAGTGCSINQSIGAVANSGSRTVSPVATTTYTLTCNGQNGGSSATSQATVTVNPAPVNAVISSFTATPSTITNGQSSTLAWSVSAGTGCSINQSIGAVATSGSQTVSPTATTTYTLSCSGLNGGASDTEQVTVTVNASAVNANISSFTATPSTITNGQSSTLAWSVSAGINCSINQGVGTVPASGSQLVSPTSTATYTMTCDGLNGGLSDTETITVTVNPAPVNANITNFTASPSSINEGQSSTLAWSVSAGTGCSINQGVGAVANSGTLVVEPTTTTTYTISCSGLNGGNADTEAATVTVSAPPVNASITSFSASPGSITDAPGESATLTWSVSSGAGCSIDQGVGIVSLGGTRAVSPTTTTTYTLTCNGQNGGTADSLAALVTVTSAPDSDADGAKDYVEEAGPNNGDANYDSIQDSQQASVTTLKNAKTGTYNTIIAAGDCDVVTQAASSGGNQSHPQGVWTYHLSCDTSGGSADVEILLDKQYDTSGWKVAKVNNALTSSSDITSQVKVGSKTLGSTAVTTLSYMVTDGGSLDEDAVANASIIDPIAVLGDSNTAIAPDSTLSETGLNIHLYLVAGAALLLTMTIGLLWRSDIIDIRS